MSYPLYNTRCLGNGLVKRQVIATKDGQAMADLYGIPFVETSAKANLNVASPFVEVARRTIDAAAHGTDGGKDSGKVRVGAADPHAQKPPCASC